MACLKMPEVNNVLIAGNLTKDPVIRKTSNGIPVINFYIASNRKYRDANNHWAEDVCYVGVVAWSRLAESCLNKLKKGSAVLVDGELQSRTWHTEDGQARTVVEIKAHRIQFLNKQEHPMEGVDAGLVSELIEDGRMNDVAGQYPEEYEVLAGEYAAGGYLEEVLPDKSPTFAMSNEMNAPGMTGHVPTEPSKPLVLKLKTMRLVDDEGHEA